MNKFAFAFLISAALMSATASRAAEPKRGYIKAAPRELKVVASAEQARNLLLVALLVRAYPAPIH